MLNQFIPIVLGVYVGILASNWNSNRVRIAEQKEFLNNLDLEIQSNRSKLEEALSYRQTIFLSAKKVRQELDQKTMEANFWSVGHWTLLPDWEGLKMPTLENSVYQSAVMTNALSGLDFKVINTIARSYNYQEDYKVWAQKLIFDNLTQLGSDVKTVEALNKLELWNDVIFKEKELIEQYDQALNELSKLNYE